MASSHVRLMNTSKAPVTLAYLPEDVKVSSTTTFVSLEGNYVPVERERVVRKVLKTVTIPAQIRDTVGSITISRKEYEQLDPEGLNVFERILLITDAKG